MAKTTEVPSDDNGVRGSESTDAAFGSWDKARGLHYRLLKARHDAKQMDEKGEVKIGNTVLYKFIKGDDVTNECNRILTLNGVCPIPKIVKRKEKEGVDAKGKPTLRTSIKVKLKLVNVDDRDDVDYADGWGSSNDNQDKGDGKAYSYANKYALMKTLGLNSSDDIEDDQIRFDQGAVTQDQIEEFAGKIQGDITTWATKMTKDIRAENNFEALEEMMALHAPMLENPALPKKTKDHVMKLYKERHEFLKEALKEKIGAE